MNVGETKQYTAIASFSDNTTLDVTKQSAWASSNDAVATIANDNTSSGLATGASKGSANINAVYKAVGSNEATLTVSDQPVVNYTLTVNTIGTGTVSSNPAGVSCGNTCSAPYVSGTNVILNASANTDSDFTGWGGSCSGVNLTCTVSMDAAKSATATFNKKMFTLTVEINGTGTGSVASLPAGIACGGSCSKSFVIGTSVTLTPTPATDSTFTGWAGTGATACSGTGSCGVAMSAAKTVIATFTKVPAPTCTIASSYKFYDIVFARKVAVTFTYAGVVTTATVGGLTSNASGSTHLVAAPAGTIQGSVTGPGGTGTCTLPVTATTPIAEFVIGTIETHAQSGANGAPGNGTLNFRLKNKDQRLVIVSVAPKVLSADFKYISMTSGTNTATGGGLYEQAFAAIIKFKYVNLDKVRYNGQLFELTMKDSVTNVIYKMDVPIVLFICKQQVIATCTTGTPNGQANGAAGYPGATPANFP